MDERSINRLKGLMGLCVRAGHAVFGEDSCMKEIREERAALLLMDESISENSRQKVTPLCERPFSGCSRGCWRKAPGCPERSC